MTKSSVKKKPAKKQPQVKKDSLPAKKPTSKKASKAEAKPVKETDKLDGLVEGIVRDFGELTDNEQMKLLFQLFPDDNVLKKKFEQRTADAVLPKLEPKKKKKK